MVSYFLIALLLVALYVGVSFVPSVFIGKNLSARAVAYQKISSDTSISLLVLGDSTGVGVGASKPEESVAGRFAKFLKATFVENYSVSGTVVSDLPAQIGKAKLKNYSVILLQIGANDIIRFHSVDAVASNLDAILKTLPSHDRVFLMSAGNIGAAKIFPAPLHPFYTKLTLSYHAAFAKVAVMHGVTYVNLYTPPAEDPFLKESRKYFAPDGLHPSSEGYKLWYEKLVSMQ